MTAIRLAGLAWTNAAVWLMAAMLATPHGTARADQLPERIKIGVLDATTGPMAEGFASGALPGLKVAMKELEERGGKLAGRPVDFVFADNGSDPTQSVNEARRLVSQEHINISIGPMITGIVMAVAPIYTQAKVISLGVATGTTFTPEIGPYHFSPYYNSKFFSERIAQFLANDLKARSVALLAGNGATDKATLLDIRAAVTAANIAITGEQVHETRAHDMTPQLLSLRRTNPEVIFEQSSVAEDGATILRNLSEIGWDIPVVSTPAGFFGASWVKINGPDVFTKHKVYALAYDAMMACKNDPLGQSPYSKFVERLKLSDPQNFERFNPPAAGQEYDGVQLIFTAIDQTKSVDADVLKDWIYKNAASFPAVSGKMRTPTKDSQSLFGAEAIGFTERPEIKRPDGTLVRAGC